MSATDQELLRTKNGNAPQYYNPNTDRYEVLTGRDGANSFIEKGRVVKDVIIGSKSITKTYATPMSGFGIVNNSVETLTFIINGMEIPVEENEAWDDLFEPFNTVIINAAGAFKAVVRE